MKTASALKALALLLSISLLPVPSLSLCEADTQVHAFLLQESIALTKNMDMLAKNEAFFSMYTTTIENPFAECNFSSLERAIILSVDSKTVADLVDISEGIPDIQNLTPDLYDWLVRRLADSIPLSFAARISTNLVAASQIVNFAKSYMAPSDDFKMTYVLLLFEDAPYASMVSFIPTGNGIISGRAFFTPVEPAQEMMEGTHASLMEHLEVPGNAIAPHVYEWPEIADMLGLQP